MKLIIPKDQWASKFEDNKLTYFISTKAYVDLFWYYYMRDVFANIYKKQEIYDKLTEISLPPVIKINDVGTLLEIPQQLINVEYFANLNSKLPKIFAFFDFSPYILFAVVILLVLYVIIIKPKI